MTIPQSPMLRQVPPPTPLISPTSISENNTLTTDHDCTGATQCFKLSISQSTFQNFNYLKFVGNLGIFTNPSNGIEHHGYIVHLESFNGDVSVTNNAMTDITTVISSWGKIWFNIIWSPDEEITEIYGTERTEL
jgi:hypothetical protein